MAKIIAKNKRAFFDYDITDTIEAGVVLTGQEVKSVKTGGVSLIGSYARIANGEAFLLNLQIKPYALASRLESYDPSRSRKLLLHKSEIIKIAGRAQEKGLVLLPLEIYAVRGKIKVKLGIGRPRKKIDKRELIKKREDQRRIQKTLRKNIK